MHGEWLVACHPYWVWVVMIWMLKIYEDDLTLRNMAQEIIPTSWLYFWLNYFSKILSRHRHLSIGDNPYWQPCDIPILCTLHCIYPAGCALETERLCLWWQRGPDWLGNAVESWVPLWPAHLLSPSLNLHDAAYFYLLWRISQIVLQ